MVRTPSCEKTGLKKGSWTPEEDRKLIAYVTRYGSWNWRQLPRFAGLERCGKSCRLRWLNYLRPNIKRGNYTEQEEEIIIRLHEKLGNKWSVIATHLPGRTDNEIKNHWHTNLKKRFGKKDAVQTNENVKSIKSKSVGSKQDSDSIQHNNDFIHISSPTISKASDTASSLSPQLSSILDVCSEDMNENISTESYVAKENVNSEFHGSVDAEFMNSWTLSESPLLSCTENLVVENDFGFIEETSANFWTETYLADMSLFPNEILAPLVNQSDEYIPSVSEYDADLWNLTNFHDLHVTSNPLW